MGERTGISWTTSSWNPWIGCTEVSPGCLNCYARELDKRHRYGGATHWGAGVPRYRTKSWHLPVTWNKKAAAIGERWTVFPSLCDPFDNEVPEQWRSDLFLLITRTPHLTWLLLTKRVGNVDSMIADVGWRDNLWIGASIVNQEEADRDIPKLLAVPAAKRFVSYEPALGPALFGYYLSRTNMPGLRLMPGFRDPLPGLDWVIVGGESDQGGKKARPFNIEWARSTIAQCKAAGVACFVKQLGSNTRGWCLGNGHGEPESYVDCQAYEASESSQPCSEGFCACRLDRAGADPAEWPEDLRVQEFPT